MRRVLILNYNVPPLGGAAALRGITLLRRLPELGYEPVVVTGPGRSFGRWRPKDATLETALDGVEVHRIPGPEPERSVRWRARAERWLAVPDRWSRWLGAGFVDVGRRVGGVDLVYADLGPDVTAHAGARLARELGVPYAVDLGDPWALDEMRVYQTVLRRRVDRASMRRALCAADIVVMNTAEAAEAVRRAFPPLRERSVIALPVGFDAADFAGPEPARDDGAFRIVHTGSFHTELALALRRHPRVQRLLGAGADQPVDVLTRTPIFLRRAIDRVLAVRPELAGRIELHLAGPTTDADRAALEGLPGLRLLGFQNHEETVRLIRSADLLFLPMQNLPPGHRARMVPCKGYEYLASGRPVLAAMPDGDGRDIFLRAEGAFVVRPDDVAGMADVIAAEARREQRRASVADARAGVLAELERGRLNHRLGRAFDAALDAGRGVAGEPALSGTVA